MSNRDEYTVGEQMRRQSRKRLTIAFACFSIIITFILGVLVGKVTSSDTVIYNETDSSFATLESVYEIMAQKFYYGSNTAEYREKLIEDAIKGMVDAQGDIHTQYMTPSELADFTGSLESNFVGIGVRYTNLSGKIFVITVLNSSPAEEAGLLAGDVITAIDGTEVTEENIDQVQDMIRGKEGTSVVVTVLRDNQKKDYTIVRRSIDSTVYSSVNSGVGILNISSFGTGTGTELKSHMENFRKQNVKSLIIDLRDNGGGYASTLDTICSYFMNNDEIIMIEEYRDGKQLIDRVRNSDKYEFDKIIILIDAGSASCSEVFTQAMIENCNAITVGDVTYGKGVAQVSKAFPDGSALKYTDVIWKSGKGVFVNGVGITPDYPVRMHDALYNSYITLKDGEVYQADSVAEAVRYAQCALDFLGYSVDRQDGYFSPATEAAVRQFQSSNNLSATGMIDNDTIVSLESELVYRWNVERDRYDLQMQKAMELARN